MDVIVSGEEAPVTGAEVAVTPQYTNYPNQGTTNGQGLVRLYLPERPKYTATANYAHPSFGTLTGSAGFDSDTKGTTVNIKLETAATTIHYTDPMGFPKAEHLPPTETVHTYHEYHVPSETPTKYTYNFDGWEYTDRNGQTQKVWPGDQLMLYSGDMYLNATWEPITYTVTYDANGGAGAPPPQKNT